jgi:hypothetical protein
MNTIGWDGFDYIKTLLDSGKWFRVELILHLYVYV